MFKSILVAILLFSFAIASSWVSAEELSIEGNAPGSSNTVTVNSGSTVNQTQSNSANITTHINASSSTGGNSASGNSGDSTIVTGDSSVEVKVKNIINSNLGQSGCCITPTVTPSPVPVGGGDTKPSQPGSSQSSSSQSSSSASGGGPGQVLGLPYTSSVDPVTALASTFGLLCLAAAALHLKSLSL